MSDISELQLLRRSADRMTAAGIEKSRWTAEQLLAHRLGCHPVRFYLDPLAVGPETAVGFEADVAARMNGMPLQYVMGNASFFGREFSVGPGVFIPRPETEILVEAVLPLLMEMPQPKVLDVGTGSGAIAVTLSLEFPECRVTAVDRSSLALTFARRNARSYGCPVQFFRSDLLSAARPGWVDVVAANLPYLDPQTVGTWPSELHWEPWLAQNGGENGLDLIRSLMRQAPSVLKPDGWLVLEIGMEQAAAVSQEAQRHGLRVERVVQDLAGLDRVVLLRKEPEWKN